MDHCSQLIVDNPFPPDVSALSSPFNGSHNPSFDLVPHSAMKEDDAHRWRWTSSNERPNDATAGVRHQTLTPPPSPGRQPRIASLLNPFRRAARNYVADESSSNTPSVGGDTSHEDSPEESLWVDDRIPLPLPTTRSDDLDASHCSAFESLPADPSSVPEGVFTSPSALDESPSLPSASERFPSISLPSYDFDHGEDFAFHLGDLWTNVGRSQPDTSYQSTPDEETDLGDSSLERDEKNVPTSTIPPTAGRSWKDRFVSSFGRSGNANGGRATPAMEPVATSDPQRQDPPKADVPEFVTVMPGLDVNEALMQAPRRSLSRRRGRNLLLLLLLVGVVCGVGSGVIARNRNARSSESNNPRSGPNASDSGNGLAHPSSSPTSATLPEAATPAPSSIRTSTSSSPTNPPTKTFSTSAPTVTSASTTFPPLSTGMTLNPGANVMPYTLPSYPIFRFRPWANVSSFDQTLASNFLGYSDSTWNVPGTVNRGNRARFWEGYTFATIQNSVASLGVISSVATLGFTSDTWDCWVNHYQNFSWTDLPYLSSFQVTITHANGGGPSNVSLSGGNGTVEQRNGGGSSSVVIGGRDIPQAMMSFGWTAENWTSPERFQFFFPLSTITNNNTRPLWKDLTMEQQIAAMQICYTANLWDRIPIPEWNN